MKILMLTYEIADEGGNFIRSFSLAKNLVKFGHEVTILASNKKISVNNVASKRDGVTIIEIACILPHRLRHNGTSPFQIIGRVIYVLKNKYDIVHGFGHRPSVAIPAMIHRWVYNKPYLADWSDLWGWGGLASHRGGILGNTAGFLDDVVESLVYRIADAVTVISKYLKEKCLRLKINKKRTYYLPPGSNIDTIYPLPQKEMRQKYNFYQNSQITTFVGNASYDAELLARSFISLTHLNKKVKLLFLGAHMPVFDSLIEEAGLSSRVIHKGFVKNDQLGPWLAIGDVMLLPYTNREINLGRYPNKIGDYMAAGRPTVANPTGDIKKLFIDGKIGLLASESPKDFARAINKLLTNSKLRNSFGRNARKTAESQWSWKTRAIQLNDIYLSLVVPQNLTHDAGEFS